jgi:hypothetical protein
MKGGSLLCGFKLGLIPRILHGGWGRQWRACCLCKEATTTTTLHCPSLEKLQERQN